MSAVVTRGGALAGLGNQTRREAASWWATGRWWRQAAIWTVLLGGMLVGMIWVLPAVLGGIEGAGAAVATAPGEVAAQFAELAAVVTAVGVVILTQGIVLDEQRLGLTEWLLSMPLSRSALVLAKFAGHASGLLVSLVALPWAVVYLLLSAAAGAPWPLGRFLAAVALVAVFAAFHLALVLALSVVFGTRGPVLAVPLALLVGGDFVVAAAPWAAAAVPYLLSRVTGALLATGELVVVWPLAAAAGWTLALVAAAVWRFNRREL